MRADENADGGIPKALFDAATDLSVAADWIAERSTDAYKRARGGVWGDDYHDWQILRLELEALRSSLSALTLKIQRKTGETYFPEAPPKE